MITTIYGTNNATVEIRRDGPVTIIGERLNPTGRARLMSTLQAGDMALVQRDAAAQVTAGAAILDVNAGVPGTDEAELVCLMIRAIREVCPVPLCIDSADPQVLHAALQEIQSTNPAQGACALVNSVNGESRSMEHILPLVNDYQAAVIALAMDEEGISMQPEQRLRVAEKIVIEAERRGIARQNVIVDPLVLTVSAAPQAARVTLDTARLIATELGVNITLGASNVSYGLPKREAINAAFLAMAISHGVTCPITNPLETTIRETVLASTLLIGQDEWAAGWIGDYRSSTNVEDTEHRGYRTSIGE